jgi:type I restriction enzyme M protein
MNDNKIAKINRQQEINRVAWKACDTFRGIVDPADYKNYILVFLFLKYLSDVWKDKTEEYSEKYTGDMEKVRRRLAREPFVLPDHCTFDYLYENRNQDNIGELINEALLEIEEKNKAKLEGVFRNIDFNSETQLGEIRDRNRRLKHLIEDFSDPRLDLRPSHLRDMDIIGNVYEYLIARFASDAGKKGGEFYTPPEVATLLARLLEPRDGDQICDPACGSASLLIKVAKEIGSNNHSLYGQESNSYTWALAKMNVFLHFIDNAVIHWGNTLSNPKLLDNDQLRKFDIVAANPPFSLDKWGAENAEADRFQRFHRGIPPRSKGDYAFISHMIETMAPATGRIGVIVPHGVLFRAGAEGRIRQKLIEENLLHAVIGLPPNLFFGTGIPASILIFKHTRDTTDILFIDASREFDKEKTQNRLRPQDLDKILDTYQSYRSVPKYSYRASSEKVRENEYNLNIPRYVDTFEEEREIDIQAVQKEIEDIESQLAQIRAQMKRHLKDLGIDG